MTENPSSQVRGIVLNAGVANCDQMRGLVDGLYRDVPKLALLGRPREIRQLGVGSEDFLLEFHSDPQLREIWSAIHSLKTRPEVRDAEPAVQTKTTWQRETVRSGVGDGDHLPESDPYDWSIRQTNIGAAWRKFGVTGKGITIGHPDTGYTNHPEIVGPRLRTGDGYDFKDDDAGAEDPMDGDFSGHGTSTASVIFSGTDATPHVHGVAPESELVPFRVSGSVIHLDFTNVVQALYAARDKGCHVVSMSLGGPWAGRSLSRAVDAFVSEGGVALAAAGNHWKAVVYPAKLDNVIAVAASNAALGEWEGSARGRAVDIAAPGESVWRARTTKDSNGEVVTDIKRSSGTSYAVATTAGVCALWLQHHGVAALRGKFGAGVATVFRQLARSNCQTVAGWDVENFGSGILDAEKLIGAELPPAPLEPRVMRFDSRGLDHASFLDRIQSYLPSASAADLRRVTASVFPEVTTRSKDHSAQDIRSLMDEFEFYVATEPAVQRELEHAAKGAKKVHRGDEAKTMLAELRRFASPELRSRLS